MTRAYDLFESIRVGGFDYVEQMIKDEVTEELFLDYKRSATAHPNRKLDISDSKNFSKAISGFGNSDGGVIIWGVDCRRDAELGDVPDSPSKTCRNDWGVVFPMAVLPFFNIKKALLRAALFCPFPIVKRGSEATQEVALAIGIRLL